MSNSIFQKPIGIVEYYDQITIGEYSFDATITVKETRGDPSAVHCGRIIYFEMLYDDQIIACFDDGKWYIQDIPEIDGSFSESANLARQILIQKWSNPEKIKIQKTVKTDLF